MLANLELEEEAMNSEGDETKIAYNLLSLAAVCSNGADLQNVVTNWHVAAFHLQRLKWVSPRSALLLWKAHPVFVGSLRSSRHQG